LPCIHCGYNLRGVLHDSDCPECGKPVSDTKEKTLFYRVLPSRLNAILIGLALVVLAASTVSANTAMSAAVRFTISGLRAAPPEWLVTLWRVSDHVTNVVYAPWIAAFLLASPLDYRKSWVTAPRLVLATSAVLMLALYTAVEIDLVTSQANNLLPTKLLQEVDRYLHLFSYAPLLLVAARLQQIAHRLPAVPAAMLGPAALICTIIRLLIDAVQTTGVLDPYATPLTGVQIASFLITLPLPVFAAIILHEARQISGEIDRTHPYTSTLA
jgi:hypothetical protein